jgi:hypothetical protein
MCYVPLATPVIGVGRTPGSRGGPCAEILNQVLGSVTTDPAAELDFDATLIDTRNLLATVASLTAFHYPMPLHLNPPTV